jgi:hypothetical protein
LVGSSGGGWWGEEAEGVRAGGVGRFCGGSWGEVRVAFGRRVREEVPLNWSKWVRQLHRWLSTVFTLVVVFNGVAVFKHRYTNWMGLLAVAALALMFFTGIYLFVLPYVTKWRSGQVAGLTRR